MSFVILYVGVGMFLLVKVEDVKIYKMYVEWGCVSEEVVVEIVEIKVKGGWVILVGMMVLWLIESVSWFGVIVFWEGEMDIFIYSGFMFYVVDVLMMNFYLFKLMLMMFVFVFVG